jgi:hypothetical protein
MNNLFKFKISLEELSKDISSKLSNGTRQVFILAPNYEKANKLLNKLSEDEMYKCKIEICTVSQYKFYMYNKFPQTYIIDLYQIELTTNKLY